MVFLKREVLVLSIADGLQGTLVILILIAIGFLLGKKGVISGEGESTLSKLAIRYSMPFLMFENARKYISGQFISDMWPWMLFIFLIILLSCAAAALLCRLFKIDRNRQGLFIVMFGFSNTILIGLPIVIELFGEQGIPFDIAFYIPNTTLFWTFGSYLLARDGGHEFKFDLALLRSILSPPFVGMVLGVAASLLGLTFPQFINSSVKYMGNLMVPLSLLLTGVFLSRMGISAFKFGRDGLLVLFGRMLFVPVITLIPCLLLGAGALQTSVFTVVSAMPVMNQSVIMAHHYGSDYKFGAQMLTVTSILSMAMLPLLVLFLGAVT